MLEDVLDKARKFVISLLCDSTSIEELEKDLEIKIDTIIDGDYLNVIFGEESVNVLSRIRNRNEQIEEINNLSDKEMQSIIWAKYYIYNDVTMNDVADKFKVSLSTLRNYMKTLPNYIKLIVYSKKQSNQVTGRIKGASNGKRTSNYSIEDIERMAREMISKDYTYLKYEELTGIPKSTLYELFDKYITDSNLREQLEKLAVEHKSYATRDIKGKH